MQIIESINITNTMISMIFLIIVLVSALKTRLYNIRLIWFITCVCLVMGGVTTYIMADNETMSGMIGSKYAYICSKSFFSLMAPIFSMYFIETERESEKKWDGAFWLKLQSGIALLVVMFIMYDVNGFLTWTAFFIQYVIIIIMLLMSSKNIVDSLSFLIGACFPIAASLFGMIDGRYSIMGFGETVMLVIVFFGYQADIEKELINKRMELSESKVSLLMEQIHPHFIYNSLQQIALLSEEGSDVRQAIYDFSAFLRSNFESLTESGMIPFEKEMDHVDLYLNLSRVSVSKKFDVVKDFKVTDFSLPALSLQPLVENAVQYGIGMSSEGEKITIQSFEEKGYIVIRVTDNGHGRSADLQTQKKHKSVGTKNVAERLRLLCNGRLEIENGFGETKASIYIPKM